MSRKTRADNEVTRVGIDAHALFHHAIFAIVCGIVCAFASMLLCYCIDGVRWCFVHAHWLIWVLPLLGVAELFLYRWWKLSENLTTRMVINNMRDGRPISWLLCPGILIGSCLSILGGACVGKEAGALQMGASIGSTLGRHTKLKSIIKHGNTAVDDMNRYSAAIGMAAAFSGLFFAPLGSCFLVLELLRFTELQNIITILIACFVASGITSYFGVGDVIGQVTVPNMDWRVVGACVVIAVATSLGGSILATLITMVQSMVSRISKHYVIWVLLGGAMYMVLVASTGWYQYTGTGGALMNATLATGNVSWDFAIKALLMIICLGFFFKGGEIMPSLCIGALLGSSCSIMTGADPCFGAAIGSMSFLAAFHRCPISSFFMGCEIFGWATAPYLVIAITIASICGYPVGIYGAGFSYFLTNNKHAWLSRLRNHELNDEMVEGRGPFDGLVQIVTFFHKLTTPPHQSNPDDSTGE